MTEKWTQRSVDGIYIIKGFKEGRYSYDPADFNEFADQNQALVKYKKNGIGKYTRKSIADGYRRLAVNFKNYKETGTGKLTLQCIEFQRLY